MLIDLINTQPLLRFCELLKVQASSEGFDSFLNDPPILTLQIRTNAFLIT